MIPLHLAIFMASIFRCWLIHFPILRNHPQLVLPLVLHFTAVFFRARLLPWRGDNLASS